MTSTGGPRDGHGYDPDATVTLPVVPIEGPGSAEQTLLLPLLGPGATAPTHPLRDRDMATPTHARPGRDATAPVGSGWPDVTPPAHGGGRHPAVGAAPVPAWSDPDPTAVMPTIPAHPTVPMAAAPPSLPPAPGRAAVPVPGDAWGPAEPVLAGPAPAAVIDTAAGIHSEQPSVGRASAVMAAGSLVSRITGLLRTVAIGAALGASVIGNDYNLANTVPNMVYELLLGGVLASVLVPFLMRARLADADRGEAYAQRLLTLATVLLGGATALAVAAAPLLTRLFTLTARNPRPTGADLHLITMLSYLILPEIFFYGMAALIAAILNTRGHFAAPTWTPILNNLVVIATAAVYIALPSAKVVTTGNITTAQVLVLGVGTTLGIVVQAAGLFPALRRVKFRWKWRFDWRELHLRVLARASGWMLAYVIVSQIGLIILLILLYGVGDRVLSDGTRAPGIAIYNSAFLIFMMAHGIVAVSIMTALMPRMSAAAAEGRFPDLANQFSQGTRLSAVILIPATAGYIVLGQPLAVTLFQWGAFTHAEAVQTGTVIAVAALGLVPFAISQMQLFAFYAMPDTRTPALLNVPVVVLRVAFDVLFYLVLPYALVTAGLMFANGLSYVLAAAVGYLLLRRRIGRLGLTETLVALARLAIAAVVAALPAWLAVTVIGHTMGTGKVASMAALVAGGIVLVGGYFLAAVVVRARDVTEVISMVKGRLGR